MSGSPAGRVLTLLERVQERPGLTAPRLAEELGVSERTVRRYVTTLHDLGIPVEAGRGKFGGHRLRPGFRMPPLMLTTDEAVAVTLALAVMRGTDVRPRRRGRDRAVQARPGAAAGRVRPGGRRARRGQPVDRRVAGRRDPRPRLARRWRQASSNDGGAGSGTARRTETPPSARSTRTASRCSVAGATSTAGATSGTPAGRSASTGSTASTCSMRPSGCPPTSMSSARSSGRSPCPGRSSRSLLLDGPIAEVEPWFPRFLGVCEAVGPRPHPGAVVDEQPGLLRAADQRPPVRDDGRGADRAPGGLRPRRHPDGSHRRGAR